MKKMLLLLAVLHTAGLSAFGQSPWVVMPGTPNLGDSNLPYCVRSESYLTAPQAGVVWGLGCVCAQYIGMQYYEEKTISTADGGQTWQSFTTAGSAGYSGVPGSSTLDMAALDGTHAWLLVRDNVVGGIKLYATASGAANFAVLNGALPAGGLVKIHFFTATTGVGIAPSTTNTLYRTTDGGLSWTPVALPAIASPGRINKFGRGNSLWITTGAGDMLRTADAGLTWSGTRQYGKVAFEDPNNGLLYDNTTLSRTSDGGLTWVPVAYNGPALGSIAIVPGRAGTYIASGNYLLGLAIPRISYDQGSTWQPLSASTNYYGLVVASSAAEIWASPTLGNQAMLHRYAGTALAAGTAVAVSSLVAYPNPTAGTLRIAGDLRGEETVRVYDAAGRLCHTSSVVDGRRTVDLSAQPAGLYQLVLTSKTGTVRQQRVNKAE